MLPVEIVAHRIVWSVPFLLILVLLWRKGAHLRAAMTSPRVLLILLATAVLIAVNWLVYIYAVVSGHVLECLRHRPPFPARQTQYEKRSSGSCGPTTICGRRMVERSP